MNKHCQKVILTFIMLVSLQQMFAQIPSEKNKSAAKVLVLEDYFNNEDRLKDKITIITENKKANIYYQQNLGNNKYTPLIKIDTFITPKNDVIPLISYNSKTGNKDIIIGERNDHNPTKLDLSRSRVISIDTISKKILNSSQL